MALRYTIRFKPERDADLIAWLDGLGDGERSCFIRNALRRALNETQPQISMQCQKNGLDMNEAIGPEIGKMTEPNSSEPDLASKLDQLTDSF